MTASKFFVVVTIHIYIYIYISEFLKMFRKAALSQETGNHADIFLGTFPNSLFYSCELLRRIFSFVQPPELFWGPILLSSEYPGAISPQGEVGNTTVFSA
jgi:hypothetical protein